MFLQYLLGLQRLGYDVALVDRLEPDMCRRRGGQPCAAEDSVNVRYLAEVMERFGLGRSLGRAVRRRRALARHEPRGTRRAPRTPPS